MARTSSRASSGSYGHTIGSFGPDTGAFQSDVAMQPRGLSRAADESTDGTPWQKTFMEQQAAKGSDVRSFVMFYGLHLVCFAVVFAVALPVLGWAFSTLCTYPPDAVFQEYAGCMSRSEFVSIILIFTLGWAGVVLLGTSIQGTAILAAESGPAAQRMMLSAIVLECAIGLVTVVWVMARPQDTWDLSKFDPLQVFFGGLFAVGFLFTGGAAVASLMRAPAQPFKRRAAAAGASRRATSLSNPAAGPGIGGGGGGGYDSTTGGGASPALSLTSQSPARDVEPSRFYNNSARVFTLLLFLASCLFLTASLSPVFNYQALYYFPLDSPYSMVHHFTTPTFAFKLYQDAVTYYSFMAMVVIVGSIAHFHLPTRRALHRRLRAPLGKVGAWVYPHGVTVGELVLTIAVVGLYTWWVDFWKFRYPRITQEAHKTPNMTDPNARPYEEYPALHEWARVMGHMTSLSISLLTFPVARNSMWEYVFGMPFERAIRIHRGLGGVVWTMITLHVLLWWIKWGKEGILAKNLVNWAEFHPAKGQGHYDNFTIVLCQACYLLVSAMIGVAVFVRRKNYELFLYTHYFAIVFIVVGLMHAWTFWYYGIGGLALWGFDKCLRITRGSTVTRLLRVDHAAGITRLVFSPNPLSEPHYAGQYGFLHIPSLSPFQWHPFSISSAPSDGLITFHIRDMGAGTWTGDLASLAKSMGPGGAGADMSTPSAPESAHGVRGGSMHLSGALGLTMFHAQVDAPYGRASYFADDNPVVVLVAAGIGITPMHSIFAELLARAESGKGATGSRAGAAESLLGAQVGSVRKVILVWSVRKTVELTSFAETFLRASRGAAESMFEVHLHTTQRGPGAVERPPPGTPDVFPGVSREAVDFVFDNLKTGRPDVDSICAAAVDEAASFRGSAGAGGKAMAMVCGPPVVVHSVSEVAFKRGMGFHTEIFAF